MGEFVVLTICSVMFLGSYAAGCVPLFFSLDERRIRLTTIFGAGLLIGTALSVIIPEGISTLYESAAKTSIALNVEGKTLDKSKLVKRQTHEYPTSSQQNIAWRPLLPDLQDAPDSFPKKSDFQSPNIKALGLVKREIVALKNGTKEFVKNDNLNVVGVKPLKQQETAEALLESSLEHQHPDFGKAIGLVLTLGFLFMFIVDQFSKAQATGRNKSVSTIGLVIHAAADGIAMGSASAASETEMQMIVFFAIMIHKGPAAFALVSFLLMEGLEKYRVRKHLLVFSLAAPLGTIFTYIFLQNIEAQSASSTTYGTGLIILFSGGTFLYIAAAHILPELMESKYSIVSAQSRSSHFSLLEVFLFVLSAMLPSMFASHHH